MNDALLVTFGPVGDRMFIAALALIIFVNGVTAALWIFAEGQNLWNKLRGKKTPSEVEQTKTRFLYEVQWSFDVSFETIQTRVSDSVDRAIVELVTENFEGYIRYRPYDGEHEWPWGNALYRDRTALQHNELYSEALETVKKHADEWQDLNFNEVAVWTPPEEEAPKRTNYIIEWSNNSEFSETSPGGITQRFLTQDPESKIREILEAIGNGYIRYRLSEDDSWIPNGYVTKDMVNAKHL